METKRKPYKVVRVFSRLNIGGPSFHVVNLSQGLSQFGYQTTLVVGKTDPWEGDLHSYAKTKKVEPLIIAEFGVRISILNDVITFFKLLALLRKERPDILHTHTFKAGVLGRVAGFIVGVPVIIHTYHGHLLNHYWSGWKIFILKSIESFLGRLSSACFSVSRQVSDDLVRAKIVPPRKMMTLELGFDLDYLDFQFSQPASLRKRLNLSDDDFVFGTACRLVPIKNIQFLIDASIDTLQKFKHVHLVIIGQGPEKNALLSSVQRYSETHPSVLKQIHFLDWIVPFQCELKDFNLYVCCSKNEGTSVAVIEALIAKVPVISTAVGGMPDLLENGKLGDLVESENKEQLSSAIQNQVQKKRVSSDPRLEEISLITRQRFSADRLCLEIDAIYRKLLSDSSRKA